MKKPTARWLSLLLSLALAFSLAVPALAEGETEGEQPEKPGETEPSDPKPNVVASLRLGGDIRLTGGENTEDGYTLQLEPSDDSLQLTATPEAADGTAIENADLRISWSSDNEAVVSATAISSTNGHSATVIPRGPGVATVTVSADNGNIKRTIAVTVSGIKLSEKLKSGISVKENESVTLTPGKLSEEKDFEYFGNAAAAYPTGSGNATLTAEVVNGKTSVKVTPEADRSKILVEGIRADTATIRITVNASGRNYTVEIPVTVTPNTAIIHHTTGVSPTEPLKFSSLAQQIANQCREITGESLSYVTGLTVPTAQGTLYLGWQSADNTGMGVGSSLNYYASTASRGPYLSDVVFVPNASFGGEKASITYTGTASNGRTYRGEIQVTLKESSTDLTLTTKRAEPVKLTGSLFDKVCQEQTGTPLDYVVFTLPPASQGALYTGYKSELDYAARVTATDRYTRSALDNITFVPAADFVGTATISYFGYSTSGARYAGELLVKVEQGLDDSIVYNDNGAGRVTFRDSDFYTYCTNATRGTFAYVTFTLPAASQGTLTFMGAPLAEGQQVYLPSRVTFTAASGFSGVVRIPFTGCDRAGNQFKGTVELHFQSGGESGLTYYCAPGSSVKLVASDFNDLSMAQTGQRLHYISFQSLPDHNKGALYHNRTSSGGIGTRVKKDIRYFQGAVPYISNLSFWATDKFTGTVEIPFTGCSTSGQTFSGLVTIHSGSGGGSGGSQGTISYSTTGREHVKFRAEDFDTACRGATNSALSYVRFSLPASSQGILYFDYQPTAAPTAASASTDYYRNGDASISKISFHPAYGFSGVVSIPFSGSAIDGSSFQGTVTISVAAAGSSGTTVRYATFGSPVKFSASDFLFAAGTNQPVSVRLGSLPAASAGKVYYQYVNPSRYSWQANTSTDYSLGGDPLVSNLTFVPRAGYVGMVTIPYTATNLDGTQYTGEVRITVNTPSSSEQFDDMEGYDGKTLAAVEYLVGQRVVNGMGNRKYGPALSIRRGDFCLMLYRAYQFESGGTAMSFSDVPGTAYYAQAVNTLSSLGVVNGTGNNRFQPDAAISRQDAALMIQRTLRNTGLTVENGTAEDIAAYADAAGVAYYAQGAVSGLVRQGIFPIGEDNRLASTEALTRADMAVLLHRAMTQ